MRLILFIAVILFSNTLIAQNTWAPLGAKWTYGIGYAFGPDVTYNEWMVTGDTLIEGQLCSIAERNGQDVVGDYDSRMITYEDNGIVYWRVDEAFTVLYDFNKNEGETYTVTTDTCSWVVNIDSTDIDIVNGIELKMQYVSADFPNYYTGVIMERVGHLTRPNPYLAEACGMDVADYNYYTALRCYEDSEFPSHFFTEIEDCFAQSVGINDVGAPLGIHLYPNPVDDILNLDVDLIHKGMYTIIDVSGREVQQGKLKTSSNNQIDISGLNPGLYLLQLQSENKIGVEKVRVY